LKTLDENRWLLIRGLFVSRDRFLRMFRTYERRVQAHSRKLAVDRTRLDLPWTELRSLLDFDVLEQIRDEFLEELKEVAHDLFRSIDSTDILDSYIAQIYHEVSILKEEHYGLEEEYLENDAKAYERVHEEVKDSFPSRLRHIRDLFVKCRRRLERIIPAMMEGSIVIRSLYLFGDEIVGAAYRDGLVGLYRKAYPEEGEVRGYYDAAQSFRRGGFDELAKSAIEKAHTAAARGGRGAALTKLRRQIRAERQALANVSANPDRMASIAHGPIWARRPA
jgi:hypothetical protein